MPNGVKNVKQVLFSTAASTIKIWERSGIPICSIESVYTKMKRFYEKGQSLKKIPFGRWNQASNRLKINSYKEKLLDLFDIAACKCKSLLTCACMPSDRVPIQEHGFLIYQRSHRLMFIGSVDLEYSQRLNNAFSKKKTPNSEPQITNTFHKEKSSSSLTQMRISLPTVATECDRFNISDRSAAAISNAVLKDVGILSECNRAMIIDRSKIRRERKKKSQLTETFDDIQALFFDGRKDETLDFNQKLSSKMQEHVTILSEPSSKFMGHVSVSKGDASSISNEIINIVEENNSIENIGGIGCDGTAVNTGSKGGVIVLLENYFNRSLQWIICLLHINELPLRHLITKLDGSTKTPSTLSGPIGLQLPKVNEMPLKQFQLIHAEVIDFDVNALSNDQTYLLKITNMVACGTIDAYIMKNTPGKLNHSRWLTTANRILRLYVATDEPTPQLKMLAKYIVDVYSPVYFAIKKKPSIENGSKHFFKLVKGCNSLPDELRGVTMDCLCRNAFFAHSENIILSLLCDDEIDVRKKGIHIFLLSREGFQPKRKFSLPCINSNAENLIGLLDPTSEWHSPPLLSQFSSSEIEWHANNGSVKSLICGIPCHSQAVERHVRLVTKSSKSVCGQNRRNIMVRNTIYSQKKNSTFNSKHEYNF